MIPVWLKLLLWSMGRKKNQTYVWLKSHDPTWSCSLGILCSGIYTIRAGLQCSALTRYERLLRKVAMQYWWQFCLSELMICCSAKCYFSACVPGVLLRCFGRLVFSSNRFQSPPLPLPLHPHLMGVCWKLLVNVWHNFEDFLRNITGTQWKDLFYF